MPVNYFGNQRTIAYNLIVFMRLKGCSRLSLSKLSGIDRSVIDQILGGENTNESLYNSQITQISKTFELPNDYFLKTQTDLMPQPPLARKRNSIAQEYLDGLDNILDIFSMYAK
ncbi:hypothetical protein ACP26L_17655 [Paenibacillus sp. S-38]|uniref:hypothetical protein n=1 Tax=Paenibacillus sp. S-38 TaxID=3416710 RepID=UPI003CF232D7